MHGHRTKNEDDMHSSHPYIESATALSDTYQSYMISQIAPVVS